MCTPALSGYKAYRSSMWQSTRLKWFLLIVIMTLTFASWVQELPVSIDNILHHWILTNRPIHWSTQSGMLVQNTIDRMLLTAPPLLYPEISKYIILELDESTLVTISYYANNHRTNIATSCILLCILSPFICGSTHHGDARVGRVYIVPRWHGAVAVSTGPLHNFVLFWCRSTLTPVW